MREMGEMREMGVGLVGLVGVTGVVRTRGVLRKCVAKLRAANGMWVCRQPSAEEMGRKGGGRGALTLVEIRGGELIGTVWGRAR